MSGGVFAVSRGIFDHDFFAKEPFTEREAWIWLIREAAWKERRVRVGRALLKLQRGQCAISTRFAADKWQWSEARVRRFLKRLAGDAMVELKTDALATRITILNYNEYQKVSLPSDAETEENRRTRDAEATHSRRKQEDRENIQTGEEEISLTGRCASEPKDVRKALWDDGVPIVKARTGLTESKARRLVGQWVKMAGDNAATVLAKIRQANADGIVDIIPWMQKALAPPKPPKPDWGPEYRGVIVQ